MTGLQYRQRAFRVHLFISLLVATLAAGLVFGLWYPYPYREISGGRQLFLMVTGIDVLIGPLITFLIFNPLKKARQELLMDLTVVGLLQMGALGYGLWTVAEARPVHLVFENNRYSVVSAAQVPDEMIPLAPKGVDIEPWMGPTLLSLRPFKNSNEQFDATMSALNGAALAARPDLWQSYDAARDQIKAQAKPLSELVKRHPEIQGQVDLLTAKFPDGEVRLAYLPLAGRNVFWTVVIDRTTADVVGFLPVDSF